MRLWLTPGKLVRCEAGSSVAPSGTSVEDARNPLIQSSARPGLSGRRSRSSSQSAVACSASRMSSPRGQFSAISFMYSLSSSTLTNGEARAREPLTRAPQLDVVALAEEHHRELAASGLGAVEVPDVDREDDVAAGGAQRAGLLAEEQDHLRARIREIGEARARDLRVRLPAVLELVARGLRERIADLPEALHEAVALVRLRQGEERLALGIGDQQRDLLEEAAVAVGHRGRVGRRTGAVVAASGWSPSSAGVGGGAGSGAAAGSCASTRGAIWARDSAAPPASSRRSMSTQRRRVTESVYG